MKRLAAAGLVTSNVHRHVRPSGWEPRHVDSHLVLHPTTIVVSAVRGQLDWV
jgi:hypothetical protein